MKKILLSFILGFWNFGISQCTFNVAGIQVGATQSICINTNATTTVTNVGSGNHIKVNVVQGYVYNFLTSTTDTGYSKTLTLFNSTDTSTSLAYGTTGTNGTTGAGIFNWTASFTGIAIIQLNDGACLTTLGVTDSIRSVYVTGSNTVDNPNTFGTDTWVGHIYNYTDTATTPPSNSDAFTEYLGYYTIGSEVFSENFGASTCVNYTAAGTSSTYYKDTFAIKYKMHSTRPAGCYVVSINSDDGFRLTVDGVLVLNRWYNQNISVNNILIYLNGNSDILLEYYEKTGTNIISYNIQPFDPATNVIDISGNNSISICSNASTYISGSMYTYYSSTTSNPTILFQWQRSTDNITFTNIAGATAKDYVPPVYTTANTYYYRRIAYSSAFSGSCSFISNVVSVTTTSSFGPNRPNATAATAIDCTSFTANWTAPTFSGSIPAASGYLLDVSTSSTFDTFLPGYEGLDIGNVLNYTVSGLSMNTYYFYRLRAYSASGCDSRYSNTTYLRTNTIPGTVSILNPTYVDCNNFLVNWNGISTATSYLLDISTVSTFATFVPGYQNLDVGNITSYNVNLPIGTYYIRMKALNSCGVSTNYSSTLRYITVAPPYNLTSTGLSCSEFTLNWTGQAHANYYILDMATSSSFSAASMVPGYNGLNVGNVTSINIPNTSNTTLYIRVRAVGSCGTSANTNTLTINFTTTWNGFTWSNGDPNISKLAIINGNYDMTVLTSFESCSLKVNSPYTLTVDANKYILIQNDLTVNPGASINILNSGSLVQVDDTGINTGVVSLNRQTNIRLNDYVYWSSPVANFNVSSISPLTPSSGIFSWNPTILNPNGGEGNWTYASGTMTIGKGYIVRGPNTFNNLTPQLFSTTFNGTPNNGIINTTIERGNNTGAGSNGLNGVLRTVYDDNWNLIGNPYPSSISAASFLNANTNIEGAVRIWSHTNLPSISNSDPFYDDYQYNYTPGDYIVYNGTATTSGPSGFSGYIASGQSFFVLMNEGTASSETVTFNNAMRNSTYTNNEFFRSSNSNPSISDEKGRIWLDLIDENKSNAIRTVIGYVNGASNSKDRLFDASTDYKNQINFYSIIDESIFTIQGRSLPFKTNDFVNLGYKTSLGGNFSIGIAAIDGFFTNGQRIYLEDKNLNIIHDLTESPYTFSTQSGIINNRFVLRYTTSKNNSSVLSDVDSVSIHKDNNNLTLVSNGKNISSYEVYDILGRLLLRQSQLNDSSVKIDELTTKNETLLIKITLTDSKIINKKVIF